MGRSGKVAGPINIKTLGNIEMKAKKLVTGLFVTGALALTGTANAFTSPVGDILILDGITTDGAAPITFVFEKTDPRELALEIKWDFTFEAFSPSWGSELGINVTAPDGSSWTLGTDGNACGPCDFDFGFTDTSGIFSSGGSIDLGGLFYGLGFWEITIFESFDDAGIDGQFLQGVIGINKALVPVPAAVWLFVSGLAGLGALRRRRAA